MRTFFSTLILFVLSFTAVYAQKDNKFEYGRISQEEADLKVYPNDKNAEAVVLFDVGTSYFRGGSQGFEVIYERTTKVKVLSEAGVKYAEILIPYYQEGQVFEHVFELEGTTYNYDGTNLTKSPLKDLNSYDEKVNNYWMMKKVVMPDVKPGSIFEIKYKISSEFLFNLRDWEFQWKIPVMYSQYTVKMVPFYEYVWTLQGDIQPLKRDSYVEVGFERQFGAISYKDMVHDFSMTDIPAFKDEEYITSINDYITKIDFQLSKVNYHNGGTTEIMTTWEQMNKELLNYQEFGKYVTRAEKIGEKLPIIQQLKDKSDEVKFNAVVDFVKDNYSWNGIYGKYATKTPANFEKEKTGNVAEINLFTIGLLRSAGLEAYPVLLSTRNNGKLKMNYPFVDAFNYVVAISSISNRRVVADATEPMTMNYRLPLRALNDVGLIIQKDKIEWIDLDIQTISTNNTDVKMELQKDNILSGFVTVISNEYDGLIKKLNLGNDKDKIKAQFSSSMYTVLDTTILTKNIDSRPKPYGVSFTLQGKPEIINDKMYINPFMDLAVFQNPLKQDSRLYPIDMIYPDKDSFLCWLTIPEGWKLDHLPANKIINNELYEMEYKVIQDGKRINVMFNYSFKRGVYDAKDYSSLKFFFSEIVSKGNEKIVLSKE